MFVGGGLCITVYTILQFILLVGSVESFEFFIMLQKISLGVLCLGGVLIIIGGMSNEKIKNNL